MVKVTNKVLKQQKEQIEKLLSVFGNESYNEWLYQQQENYISENKDKALDELLRRNNLLANHDEQPEEQPEEQQEESQTINNGGIS